MRKKTRKLKMTKKKLNKLIKQYSIELHEEYMESHRYNFNAGYYRDLLSELIDKLDVLEKESRRIFS
jgi:hypothetical protein